MWVGDEYYGLRAAFLADTYIYYATNVIFMTGKGEHVMVATARRLKGEKMVTRRKDMKTTDDTMSQMLSDNINKADKVLDGAYLDTKAKYHNGKQKAVVVVGITTTQMNALKDMMNANIAFQKPMEQTASVVNRITRATRVIGRIDNYIKGVVVDGDGDNRIMTKPMIAKAKADAKAMADRKADGIAYLKSIGLDPSDLV